MEQGNKNSKQFRNKCIYFRKSIKYFSDETKIRKTKVHESMQGANPLYKLLYLGRNDLTGTFDQTQEIVNTIIRLP